MTEIDEKITGYVQRLVARFQNQLAATHDWPTSYVFPTPQDDDERTALLVFVDEVEKAIGCPILFTTEPGRA
jgi:hypothetical protein